MHCFDTPLTQIVRFFWLFLFLVFDFGHGLYGFVGRTLLRADRLESCMTRAFERREDVMYYVVVMRMRPISILISEHIGIGVEYRERTYECIGGLYLSCRTADAQHDQPWVWGRSEL